MTTPPTTTDAAKLREAAKDCLTKAKYFPLFAGSSELLARHVLATVPEDGEEPIDAKWLKDEWGFAIIPKGHPCNYQPYQLDLTVMTDQEDYGWGVCHDAERVPWMLFTRNQFRALANALGINKIKQASEC